MHLTSGGHAHVNSNMADGEVSLKSCNTPTPGVLSPMDRTNAMLCGADTGLAVIRHSPAHWPSVACVVDSTGPVAALATDQVLIEAVLIALVQPKLKGQCVLSNAVCAQQGADTHVDTEVWRCVEALTWCNLSLQMCCLCAQCCHPWSLLLSVRRETVASIWATCIACRV